MQVITALLSMLHESPQVHSAARTFRGKPVLHWTLSRLRRSASIDSITVACWADQADAVAATCISHQVELKVVGERQHRAAMAAISTARRWADGWRGGLLGSCEFDRGFDAAVARDVAAATEADAIVLIDPAAGLVDPQLIDAMIEHAENNPEAELTFSQAAPGLGGTLLRRALVDRLVVAQMSPGRMLTYWPDHYGGDPIGKPGCAPVAMPIARSTARFTLDSHRQVDRLTRSMQPLNGTLISTGAEELVRRSALDVAPDLLARDVTLEINTDRRTKPLYGPQNIGGVTREPMSIEVASAIFEQLATLDDVRLTLAGVGDPLLSPTVFGIIEAAHRSGIATIHLETDFVGLTPGTTKKLAESAVEVVTVHLPAATPPVYQQVMGMDGWNEAVLNLVSLEKAVAARGVGVPLIVPTFTKLAINLAEMEPWYDYWIRRFGHAVINGSSDYAGQTPDTSLTDMSPPQRRPCHRIERRMTILCDGRVVSCEQDVIGKQTIGTIGQTPISEMWSGGFGALRTCHRLGEWSSKPLCAMCKEWHRP